MTITKTIVRKLELENYGGLLVSLVRHVAALIRKRERSIRSSVCSHPVTGTTFVQIK